MRRNWGIWGQVDDGLKDHKRTAIGDKRMSSRFCAVSSTPTMEFAGSELILPCQYHDLSGGYQLSGEQRLMLALLADAINVYQRGALSGLTRARRLYVDAERWITS